MKQRLLLACLALVLPTVSPAAAADFPTPRSGNFVVRDFRFASGDSIDELRLHYTTVGDPTGQPVLLLHGTGGAGTNLLADIFGGELFGPGQPLDAERYYLILPDAIGTGDSSKPSDGLRAQFPSYTYTDMVHATHRLLTEQLGVTHLRLVAGFSEGGMQTWLWGQLYPGFMDALMPLSSLPVPMSGRNWIMRRMVIDAIRNDPDWEDGNYTLQPRALAPALAYYNLATSGGTAALYRAAPTSASADRLIDQRLALTEEADANDVLFQFGAARDYDPAAGLEKIQAVLLAANSADDERNPAELRLAEREITRVRRGRFVLIPASDDTRGHGSMAWARTWKPLLVELLASLPAR